MKQNTHEKPAAARTARPLALSSRGKHRERSVVILFVLCLLLSFMRCGLLSVTGAEPGVGTCEDGVAPGGTGRRALPGPAQTSEAPRPPRPRLRGEPWSRGSVGA